MYRRMRGSSLNTSWIRIPFYEMYSFPFFLFFFSWRFYGRAAAAERLLENQQFKEFIRLTASRWRKYN